MQPVAGSFECVDGAVWLAPRFPFVAGVSYTLLVDGERWTIARPDRVGTPSTTVVAIYPTAEEVPVNLLRIYVHFSDVMSEGWAARGVQVRRADTDEPLADVFVPMEPELWDGERRRLTMLLDPGRIKRGLVPNAEAGYPLVEGVPIVVAVDAAFHDARGHGSGQRGAMLPRGPADSPPRRSWAVARSAARGRIICAAGRRARSSPRPCAPDALPGGERRGRASR